MKFDVVVIGAGAAGLFCAIQASKRGRKVLVLDHAKKVGRKILMSGGGRCNFTNMYCSPENFISENAHFSKSALNKFTQWDFISLVEKHAIAYHEKTLGQLFCNDSAKDIVTMLLNECQENGVVIQTQATVTSVIQVNQGIDIDTEVTENSKMAYQLSFQKGATTPARNPNVQTDASIPSEKIQCQSLVIATGGLSMPKLGASPFGYQIAQQFGHSIIPTRAGLVPFTLHDQDKNLFSDISGVSVSADISNQRTSFNESMLFTHRGLSGPAVLQISSYWQPGEAININLNPATNITTYLQQEKQSGAKTLLSNALGQHLPKRVVQVLLTHQQIVNKPLNQYQGKQLSQILSQLEQWQIKPNGTEGYRTAEVTLGGVATSDVSSKTMESKLAKNLYFIGEVLDVTGWLGGYNFQWAWSSGWAAGQVC